MDPARDAESCDIKENEIIVKVIEDEFKFKPPQLEENIYQAKAEMKRKRKQNQKNKPQ